MPLSKDSFQVCGGFWIDCVKSRSARGVHGGPTIDGTMCNLQAAFWKVKTGSQSRGFFRNTTLKISSLPREFVFKGSRIPDPDWQMSIDRVGSTSDASANTIRATHPSRRELRSQRKWAEATQRKTVEQGADATCRVHKLRIGVAPYATEFQ
jgi:hypothetical protein